MAVTKVFISYKRKEFYFAEHLSTLLKSKHGIDAWFDIHELQAGADWSTTINTALNAAEGLVLVASKAALQSPYVKIEWESALKAGKPVVVAFFEPVDLPPELAKVPYVDLRGNFERGVAKIAAALNAPDKPVDKAPKAGIAAIRFPLPVWIVIAGTFMVALAIALLLLVVVILIQQDQSDVVLGWIMILSTPLAFYLMLRSMLMDFINRTYRTTSLQNAFLFIAGLSGAILLIFYFASRGLVFPLWVAVIFGAICAISAASWWLLDHSAALLRWAPTGQASQALRERVNKAVQRRTKPQFSDIGKTYSLHYDATDASVANDVRNVMNTACFHEIPAEQTGDHEVIIVSNTTPLDVLAAAVTENQALVTVVSTAFKIPDSGATKESNVHLSKFQWIDYRKRDKESLQNMVEDLFLRDTGQPNEHYAFKPVPENYENHLPPPTISAIVQSVTMMGGLGLITVLNIFFTALTSKPLDVMNNRYIYNPVTVSMLIVGCFLLIWLGQKIRERELSLIPTVLIAAVAIPMAVWSSLQVMGFSSTLFILAPCASVLTVIAILRGIVALNAWLLPIRWNRSTSGLGVQDAQLSRLTILFTGAMVLLVIASFVVQRLIK